MLEFIKKLLVMFSVKYSEQKVILSLKSSQIFSCQLLIMTNYIDGVTTQSADSHGD